MHGQVMEAAAYLVGHMPQEQRNSVLSGMLGIVTGPMHAALAAGDVETVVVMADRLTIIFRCRTKAAANIATSDRLTWTQRLTGMTKLQAAGPREHRQAGRCLDILRPPAIMSGQAC